MNAQRISRIVGGVAVVAVALVVVMVVWSRMNQPDPTPVAQTPVGGVMGDLTGFVGRVDQKARTVEVAEIKGQRPVTMTVTDDTAITVRGEQRGLRDLKKDLPVRAFYEVRNDVKYVTRLQVVTDDAQAKAASPDEAKSVAQPAVAAAPAARGAESASQPAPEARQSAMFKSGARPAPAPAVSAAPAHAPAPAPTPAPAAAVAPPSRTPLVPPIAPAPPLTPVAEAPAPARQTISADASVSAADPDGSEAVDWLLRRRR